MGRGVDTLLPTNVIKFQEYTIELDGCVLASDYTVLFLSGEGVQCYMLSHGLDADILMGRSIGKEGNLITKHCYPSAHRRTPYQSLCPPCPFRYSVNVYIYEYVCAFNIN